MKPNKLIHRMGFGMWVSFTLLAAGIALLFWIVLGTSLKVGYQNETVRELDRVAWTAAATYGEPDFKTNLKFISGGENYFVQIVSEQGMELLLSLDNQGEDARVQAEGIIPRELFSLLDKNGGCYRYRVEDAVRNVEWAVIAIVIANWEGSREVLIFSKSLANVDYLIHLLSTRVIFALVVVLVIASVLSLIITKRFSGPMDRLTEKARLLARGNYQVDFPKKGCYEVQQLSETLEIAASEFQATEELRREFIANVSHDMKTPLTVIKMYAEMIQTVSGENPVKREEHLQRILSETEKLTGFINDTMELARLQSKTWEVKKEYFNLTQLIRAVVDSLGVHQELDGFVIEFEVEEELMVYADRKMIGRVLENFISNAIKFSIDTKRIHIKSRQEGSYVRTSVRDYGTGICADQLPFIWKRYYKVDPYGTNKTGTGIGLHIVKEIMEMHGGRYGVDSQLNQGSSFWFYLCEREERGNGSANWQA